jgi:hypothetical protein
MSANANTPATPATTAKAEPKRKKLDEGKFRIIIGSVSGGVGLAALVGVGLWAQNGMPMCVMIRLQLLSIAIFAACMYAIGYGLKWRYRERLASKVAAAFRHSATLVTFAAFAGLAAGTFLATTFVSGFGQCKVEPRSGSSYGRYGSS